MQQETASETETESGKSPIISGTHSEATDTKEADAENAENNGSTEESRNLNVMNLDQGEESGSASVINKYASGISVMVILFSVIGILLILISRRRDLKERKDDRS